MEARVQCTWALGTVLRWAGDSGALCQDHSCKKRGSVSCPVSVQEVTVTYPVEHSRRSWPAALT